MPATDTMRAILDQLAAFGMPPLPSLSPELARQLPTPADAVLDVRARQAGEGATAQAQILPEPVGHISHRVIPGPDGDLLLRVYLPRDPAASGAGMPVTQDMLVAAHGEPLPVTLYCHGGGWVIANLDACDASCRALCNAARCVVCSLAYRQAPEHKYPAATEDAFAAYQWLLAHATELSGDRRRVAVAGEGAGGNLATVVCLMARDRGVPPPIYQLLIYPICATPADTPSYQEYAHANPLDRDMLSWLYKQYLPDPKKGDEVYASPLRERNLAGLPAATIIAAELDPLRSEGEEYARRLREAGVPIDYWLFHGVTHEFFGMGAVLPEAREAVSAAADGLRMGFSGRARVRQQQARTARHADAALASPQAEPAMPSANTPPISMPTATRATPNTPASDRPATQVTPGTAGAIGAPGSAVPANDNPASEAAQAPSARVASLDTGSTVDTGAHSELPPADPAHETQAPGDVSAE